MCSLVGGLVVVFVALVPINVYTTVGATFLEAAEEAELLEESEAAVLKEAVVPVKDSFVLQTFRVLGGDLVTDAFVNFEVNGVATGLCEETETFGGVVCHTVAYINSESASAEDLIRYYVDSIEESEVLAYALGEVIYYAADAWSEGEAFIGIERPESGELFDELVSDLLVVLKTDARDAEDLREDLVTLADLLGILEEYGLLESFSDDAVLTDSVGSNGAVKALTDKLSENERMMPLVKTINRVGMRAIATSLDLSGVGRAEYDPLLGDIADTLNATAHVSRNARLALVEGELTRAFADAEVEIDHEVVRVYAEMLVDEFGSTDNLTADDIAEYLQSHSV